MSGIATEEERKVGNAGTVMIGLILILLFVQIAKDFLPLSATGEADEEVHLG